MEIKAKVYIVSCDNILIYNKFISILRQKVAGIVSKDYNTIKFNLINNLANNNLVPHKSKDISLINNISDLLNEHGGYLFNRLMFDIDSYNLKQVYMFIRVDNIKTMNKLTRILKRPNYRTVRIEELYPNKPLTKELRLKYKNYRFDNRIYYESDVLLNIQAKKFMQTSIPTLKFMHNE